MKTLRNITQQVALSGQITPDDILLLVEQGYVTLVCHRPDGEEAGQPLAAALAEVAKHAGMAFAHAPIVGMPHAEAVAITRVALEDLPPGGKALLFCRSGLRSAAAWAMAERQRGAEAESLRAAAAAAGYDLSRLPL
jgi:uncharacterized protein (TIGR01244 family)